MTLFQSIISVIFSLGFLTFLFIFIGYLAFPIFLIILAVGLFNFFRNSKIFIHKNTPQNAPNFSHPIYRKKDDKVIDVDYTELS